jgi:hypothetical protein
MNRVPTLYVIVTFLLVSSSCRHADNYSFELATADSVKPVFILPGEANHVRLAVQDFIDDLEKISGKRATLVEEMADCEQGCVIIGSVNNETSKAELAAFSDAHLDDLLGKWEAYVVKPNQNNLLIAGSDDRGTMFGIYHFIESYLEVDPLYYWTDREPEPRNQLAWKEVFIDQESPTFKYRGWFINDEDLLTGWKEGKGPRHIDYPFYATVVNPEIIEKVVEAMVRLRFNLIIPASFIDIANEPEKELVDVAAKRGVFLSMHHIEPLGVSAFTYFNYWNERGRDLKFSFYSHPEELKEIWKVYAEKWAEYPNVIWQIGLRGIADRPMWLADEAIPQSDRERGQLISQAMETQMNIIREVDKRENIPVTTTLWMEGSDLNEKGHLKFPDGVSVVFSDNSPGWMMQKDFFETEREPNRDYGIYYHHQLWSIGPHLAQGIPPAKTHEIIGQAVDHASDNYAIFNVSNIREFVLGLQATSEMVYDYHAFDPADFLKEWCKARFGDASDDAYLAYNQYFDSFAKHETSQGPILLDGQIRIKGLGLLESIRTLIEDPAALEKLYREANETGKGEFSWLDRRLTDSRMGNVTMEQLVPLVEQQHSSLEKAIGLVTSASSKMDKDELVFFESNLASHTRIMLGLTDWLNEISLATRAEIEGDPQSSFVHLENAVRAFELVKEGQELGLKGPKWENWYLGETKMNLKAMETKTREVMELASDRILQPQK